MLRLAFFVLVAAVFSLGPVRGFRAGALYACHCEYNATEGVGIACVKQLGYPRWPCECPRPRPPYNPTAAVNFVASQCTETREDAWVELAALSWSRPAVQPEQTKLEAFFGRWLDLEERNPVIRHPCKGDTGFSVQQETHIVATHSSVSVISFHYPCQLTGGPATCNHPWGEWGMCSPVSDCGDQGVQQRSRARCLGSAETETRACRLGQPRACESVRGCDDSESASGTCGGECRVRCYGPEPQTCVTEHRCNLTWSRDPDEWLPAGTVRPIALELGAEENTRDCGPGWASDARAAPCLADACTFSGSLSREGLNCTCDPETCRCPGTWSNETYACAHSEIERSADDPVPFCGQGAIAHRVVCTPSDCRPVEGTCECEPGTAPWPRDGKPCAGKVLPCVAPLLECGPDTLSCQRIEEFGSSSPSPSDWVRCSSGKRDTRVDDPDTVKTYCGPGGLSLYVTDEGDALRGTCECAGVTLHDWSQPVACPGQLPYHSYKCSERDYQSNGCHMPRDQCRMLVSTQTGGVPVVVAPSCKRSVAPMAVTACTPQQARRYCGRATQSCTWNGTAAACVCSRTGYALYDQNRPCTGAQDVRLACSPFLTRKFCGIYTGPSVVRRDASFNPQRIQSHDVCVYSPFVPLAVPPSLQCPSSAVVLRSCNSSEVPIYCPGARSPANSTTGCMLRCETGVCDLWGACETTTPCNAIQVAKCDNPQYASACVSVNYQTLTGIQSLIENCTWDCSNSTDVTGVRCDQPVPRDCTEEEATRECGPNNASYTQCTKNGTVFTCLCATNYAAPELPAINDSSNPFAIRFTTASPMGQCAGYQVECTQSMVETLLGPFGVSCQAYCLETTDPRLVSAASAAGAEPGAEADAISNWTSDARMCRLVPLSHTCTTHGRPGPGPIPGDPRNQIRPCGIAYEDARGSTDASLLLACGGPFATRSATARIFYNSSNQISRVENLTCECQPGFYEGSVYQCENKYYERPCDAEELASWRKHLPALCPAGFAADQSTSCAVKCVPGGTFVPAPGEDPIEINGTELCYGFRDPVCTGDSNLSVCTHETALRECGAYASGCRGVCTTSVQIVNPAAGLNTSQNYYTPRLVQTCDRATIRCSCQTLYPNYAPDELDRPCGRAYVIRSCTSLAEATRFCGLGGFACSKRCRFTAPELGTLAAGDADLDESDCYEAHVCRCSNDPPLSLLIDTDRDAEYAGSSHISGPLYRSCGYDLPVSRCTSIVSDSVSGPVCGSLTHAERVGAGGERICACKNGTEDLPLGGGLYRPCGAYVRDCEDFEASHYCQMAGTCKLLCDTQRSSWCQLKPGSCAPARPVALTGETKRVCITDLLRDSACTLNCTTVTHMECAAWFLSRHPNTARCFRVAEAPSVAPVLPTEGAAAAYWQYCQLPNTPACRRAGGIDQVYTGRNCFDVFVNATGERVCTPPETQRYCGQPSLVTDCRMSFWGTYARFVDGSCRCKPFPEAVTVPPYMYLMGGGGAEGRLPDPGPTCIPVSGVTEEILSGCSSFCGNHTVSCRKRHLVFPESSGNFFNTGCWAYRGIFNRPANFTDEDMVVQSDYWYLSLVSAGLETFNASNICAVGRLPPQAVRGVLRTTVECGCETDISTWGSTVRGIDRTRLDWRGAIPTVRGSPFANPSCRIMDSIQMQAAHKWIGRVPIGANGLMCGGVMRHKSMARTFTEMTEFHSDPRIWPMTRAELLGTYERTGVVYFPIPTDLAIPSDNRRIPRNLTTPDYLYVFNDTGTGTCTRPSPERAAYLASTGVVSRCGQDHRLPGLSDIECRVIPYPLPPLGENTFTESLGSVPVDCTPVANLFMSWAGAEDDWTTPPTERSYNDGSGALRPCLTQISDCSFVVKTTVSSDKKYPLFAGSRNSRGVYTVLATLMQYPYKDDVSSPHNPNEDFSDYGDTKYDLGYWTNDDENNLISSFLSPLMRSFTPELEPSTAPARVTDDFYYREYSVSPWGQSPQVASATSELSKFNRRVNRVIYPSVLRCKGRTAANSSFYRIRSFPDGFPNRVPSRLSRAGGDPLVWLCAPRAVLFSATQEQRHRYQCTLAMELPEVLAGTTQRKRVSYWATPYNRSASTHRLAQVHCHQVFRHRTNTFNQPADYLYDGPDLPWLVPGCFDTPEAGEFPTPITGCPIDGLSGPLCNRRDGTSLNNPFFEGLCAPTALLPERENACCIGSSTPCSIPPGWTGRQGCINGDFDIGNNTCVCDAPWTIPSTVDYNIPDSDRGRCINHPCMYPSDPRRNRTTPMCSANGVCRSGECQCFEGWAGQWCEVPSVWACPPSFANTSEDVIIARAIIKRELDRAGATIRNAWWGTNGRNPDIENILPCGGRGVPVAVGSQCACKCYRGDYGTWSGPGCTVLNFTREEDRIECLANGGEIAVHVLANGNATRYGSASMPYLHMPVAAFCKCPLAPGSSVHSLRTGRNCELDMCPIGPNGDVCSGHGTCSLGANQEQRDDAENTPYPIPVCQQEATASALCGPDNDNCVFAVSHKQTEPVVLCGNSTRYTGCACELDRWAGCVPAANRGEERPVMCSYTGNGNPQTSTFAHLAKRSIDLCEAFMDGVTVRHACNCPFPDETDSYCSGDVCRARHEALGFFEEPLASVFFPTGETCNGGHGTVTNDSCECTCPRSAPVDGTLRLGRFCQFDVTSACGVFNSDAGEWRLCNSDRVDGDPPRCECNGTYAEDTGCSGGIFKCENCPPGRQGLRCDQVTCPLACGAHGDCAFDSSNRAFCLCEPRWDNTGSRTTPCDTSVCALQNAIPDETGEGCVCLDPNMTVASNCRFGSCPSVAGSVCGPVYASADADPLTLSAMARLCTDRSRCNTDGRQCFQGACSCIPPRYGPGPGGTCVPLCDAQNTVEFDIFDTVTPCVCRQGYSRSSGCRQVECPTTVLASSVELAVVLREMDSRGEPICRCPFPFVSNCSAHLCQNGGHPAKVGIDVACACAAGFAGPMCEITRAESETPSPPTTAPVEDPETPDPPEPTATEKTNELPSANPVIPPPVVTPVPVTLCYNGGVLNSTSGTCACSVSHYGADCRHNYCGFGNSVRVCRGSVTSCYCVCDPNGFWDFDEFGNCTKTACGTNSILTGNECVCNSGFVKSNVTGLCTAVCPGNSTYSSRQRRCVCNTGFSGPTCTARPAAQAADPVALSAATAAVTAVALPPKTKLDSGPCGTIECAQANDRGLLVSDTEPPPGVVLGDGGALNDVNTVEAERPPVELIHPPGEGITPLEVAGIATGVVLGLAVLGTGVVVLSKYFHFRRIRYRLVRNS